MARLRKRLFLFGTIAVVGVLIGFIACAPYLLSTPWGTKQLVRFVEKTYGVTIQLDHLYLSWLGGQRVDKLTIEKEGFFHLLCPLIQTEGSLWNVVRRRGAMGKTIAHQPQLTLYAASHHGAKRQQPVWRHFQGDLTIDRARLALARNKEPPLTMTISSLAITTLTAHHTLRIKGEGKGEAHLLTGAFSLDVERKGAQWQGSFGITSFPVEPFYPLFQPFLSKVEFLFLQSLGKTLDLRLAMVPEDTATTRVECTLTTPYVRANIALTQQGSLWTLKEPGNLQWLLTPSFINPLAHALPTAASLQENALLGVSIKRAQLDFSPSSQPHILAAETTCTLERTSLLIADQPFSLSTLTLDAKKTTSHEPLSLTLATRFRASALPETELNLKAALRTSPTRWKLATLQLFLRNGPLPFIDHLALFDTALTPWLGQTVTATLTWDVDKQLNMTASTPQVALAPTTLVWDRSIQLKAPTTLTWTVAPSLASQLVQPLALSLQINALTLPFKKQKGVSWKHARFNLSFNVPTVAYSDVFTLGPLTASDLAGHLTSQGKGNAQLTASSRLAFAPHTTGAALMGVNGNASLTSLLTWDRGLNAPSFLFHLASSHLDLNLEGHLARNRLTLDRPADLALTLEPSWVNPLLASHTIDLSLTKSSQATFALKQLTFPLRLGGQEKWQGKLACQIPTLELLAKAAAYPFTCKNLILLLSQDKQCDLRLETTLITATEREGNIDLNGSYSPLSEWTLRCHHCPTPLASALMLRNNTLPALVGSTFDLSLNYLKKGDRSQITFDATSPLLTCSGSLNERQTVVSNGRTPLQFTWQMTDAGFNALRSLRDAHTPLPFTLEKGGTLTGHIDTFSVPFNSFNFYETTCTATLSLSKLVLKPKRASPTTAIDTLDIDVRKQKPGGMLTFALTSDVSSSEEKTGTLRSRGQLDRLWTPAGAFNTHDPTASIETTLSQFPTLAAEALCHLAFAHTPPLALFLGEHLSATVEVAFQDKQGTFDGQLSASACTADLGGRFSNGLLTLSRPLTAQLTITPALNEMLATTSAITIVSLSEPLTLFIAPKGFSVPLADLHLRSTQIAQGQLNFHRVVCRNQGSASDLGEVFKLNPFSSSLISLWFAPMDFTLQRGIMAIARTEILYNQAYQVALWGGIDYNKRFVSMFLGLTAQSLQAALNIGGLSSNYVLAIPIQGPFGNVKLDKKAATSKIALLIARKQIAPRAGPWGSVFGALGDLADDQSNIPPARPPFPWQTTSP